ncbi:hypothetical protein [Chitinophaga nivalis]|uniref:DoxX family protein n=1 Tax=Chitinophaga nivalis TaxID=2991709 RepID=A0ABT3IQR1_9BACT|nr:hypothetical protein [Chitinophaga nivalis]MCW3464008.1 hypothetical protein [Chitinophaga nivalis]MCW3486302.1 hypothetical protein [Chitinophaga nivalis]
MKQHHIEMKILEWKARHGLNILRVSLGFIFIWFGILKFFPGLSAAEIIAGRTIEKLTFGLLKPHVALPILAIWECIIGLGLITKSWLDLTLLLLYLQMTGTFLPLIFFPHETFTYFIIVPTLLGQYIIKNIVLLSGGIVIGATVRGGRLTARPTTGFKNIRFRTLYTHPKRKPKLLPPHQTS